MTEIPVLRPREVIRAFERLGWDVARKHGSHVILVQSGHPATLSVPDHATVARGTLRALLRRAGISPEEFQKAARGR